MVLNSDGSMTVDPVGYGGILRDSTGEAVLAFYGPALKCNVLWAELQAIQRGITLALFHGFFQLKIMSDSKLGVDILNKVSECPWKVLTLVHNIWQLLHDMRGVEIVHVWREAN